MKNVYLFLIQALFILSLMVTTGCSKNDDPGTGGANVGEPLYPDGGGSDPSGSLTTDPGVKINGVIWATRNVDKPGTFTANPEDPGMFYQWNSKVGWKYNDPLTPSDGISTWNPNWDGNGATTWEKANDPCPPGWRLPTEGELLSLTSHWSSATVNGMNGFWCGTTGAVVFLPCAGFRYKSDASVRDMGRCAYLAIRDKYTIYKYTAWEVSDGLATASLWGADASSIRCVKE